MSRPLSSGKLLLALLCLGLVASTAEAQKQQKKEVNVGGTLKAVSGNMLAVQSATGDVWKVAVAPKNAIDVTYTGTAEMSFLHPGVPVKFTGKFNGKLMGQEPVAEFTVFNGNELGVQEDGADASLFGGAPEPGKKPKKPAPVDPAAIITLNVQGTIKTIKAGKMMVGAGNKTLTFDVAETATVKVDVSGPAVLKFLQDGDTVEINKAWQEGPMQATAEDAKITGGKPLVGKTKPLVASKPTTPENTLKQPEQTKPDGLKPDGAKPEEAKPDEAKPGEAKPGDAKPGDAKPGFNVNPLFNK